jgi:hypothetical protein
MKTAINNRISSWNAESELNVLSVYSENAIENMKYLR